MPHPSAAHTACLWRLSARATGRPLELRQTSPNTYDVLWKVPARGEDPRLALYGRFPADCQKTTPRRILGGGAYVERWRVQCPGGLSGSTLRIDGLSATLTDVLAR